MTPVTPYESKPLLSLKPCCRRAFLRTELTEVSLDSTGFYVCNPTLVSRAPINPNYPAGAFTANPNISGILTPRHISKIGEPIVCANAVNMVNLALGPRAILYSPSNPVCGHHPSQYGRTIVASLSDVTEGFLSRPPGIPSNKLSLKREKVSWPRKPKQLSRFRLISKQLAAKFRRDIGAISHSEVTFRIGQGRALLTQRFRPAFYGRFTFRSQVGGEVML